MEEKYKICINCKNAGHYNLGQLYCKKSNLPVERTHSCELYEYREVADKKTINQRLITGLILILAVIFISIGRSCIHRNKDNLINDIDLKEEINKNSELYFDSYHSMTPKNNKPYGSTKRFILTEVYLYYLY